MRMHPESEQASSIRPERDGELNPEQIGTFERLSRTLVGSMPDLGVLVAGRDMRVAVMDGPIFSSAGIAAEDAVGLPLDALMTPRSAALLLPQWSAALSGSHRTLDYCSDDAHRSYSVGFGPLEDSSGEVVAAMAVIRDLTEQVTPLRDLGSAVTLQASEERLRAAQAIARIGNWEHRVDEGRMILSDNLPHLLGLPREATGGIGPDGLVRHVHPDDRRRVQEHVAAAIDRDEPTDIEFRIQHPDGDLRDVHLRGESLTLDGQALVRRGVVQDITERKARERELHDAQQLFRQGFDNAQIGMGVLDLERRTFTQVNGAMAEITGHVEQEMQRAGFLSRVSAPEHTAADDALLDGLASGAVKFDWRQLPVLHRDGSTRWVSRNLSPIQDSEGNIAAVFVQMADITEEKERETGLETEAEELAWITQIRDALDEGRFVLFAQPIIDIATGATVQQELLIRMVSEDGAIVPPGEFLPVAEKYGQVGEIDRWVVARGAELAAAGMPVAVNLSGASIGHPSLLGAVEKALASTGAPPANLVFEITETALMSNLDRGELFARSLVALGCRFSLDDFGTGFGSFTYLKRLPAHFLKIDMDFVRELVGSERDQHVVKAIVALAEGFGQQTIAEGVEDEATLRLLGGLGVTYAQGFHVGRPAPLPGIAVSAPIETEV